MPQLKNNEKEQKVLIQKRIADLMLLIAEIGEKNVKVISTKPNCTILELSNKNRLYFKYKNGKFIKMPRDNVIVELPINPINNKKHKLKTKKGKIISKNVKQVLAPPLITLVLGIAFLSTLKTNKENKETIIESLEESKEFQNALLDMNQISILEPSYLENAEIDEKYLIPKECIVQATNVEIVLKEDMSKRIETDQLFGTEINYYATRYGVPVSLASALITQERPSKGLENIGQLTRKICGEKYQVPIINGTDEEINNNKTIEKFYIVRDEPQRDNFESAESYKKELERYQNQLLESRELEKAGYQIFYFENLLIDTTQNIHISMAYLAHSVYGCNMNVHQGTRAYNCGISSAKKATDEDLQNGTIQIGDPFYNRNVLSYLYPEELEHIVWTLRTNDLDENSLLSVTMEFNNIKDRNYDYATKENGPHL